MTPNPLDPLTLASEIERAVSVGLVVQARALAIERQQSASALMDESVRDEEGRVSDASLEAAKALAARLKSSQSEIADEATYALNQVVPAVIGPLADARGVGDLMTALQNQISAGTRPEELADAVGAVVDEFSTYRDRAKSAAALVGGRVQTASDTAEGLSDTLKKVLTLSDDDITNTRTAIKTTQEEIAASIDDIVAGGKTLGSGVGKFLADKGKFVTGAITSFRSKPAKPAKPAKPDTGTEDADESGTDGKDAGTDGKDGGTDDSKKLSIESIGMSAGAGIDDSVKGAEQIMAAIQTVKDKNAALADLYQQLYQQKAVVAVASSILDQADSYIGALQLLKTALDNVEVVWGRIVDAAEGLAADSSNLAQTVQSAGARWAAALKQLQYVTTALSSAKEVENVGPMLVRK